MESQQPAATLTSNAIRHGLILGVISVGLQVAVYVVSIPLMASIKFAFLSFIVYMAYIIYAGITYRGEAGGTLVYGKAFQHGFIMLAVSGLVGTVFNFLFYHVIDPDLPKKLTQAIMDNTEELLTMFNVPQDSIDQTLDSMSTELPDQFSPGGLGLGYFKGLFYFAIVALITALFVKKNPPVTTI